MVACAAESWEFNPWNGVCCRQAKIDECTQVIRLIIHMITCNDIHTTPTDCPQQLVTNMSYRNVGRPLHWTVPLEQYDNLTRPKKCCLFPVTLPNKFLFKKIPTLKSSALPTPNQHKTCIKHTFLTCQKSFYY